MPITTAVQKYDLNFAMYFLSKEKIIFLDPFYANLCDQKLWITFFGKSPKSTHSKPLPFKVVRSCIWGGGGGRYDLLSCILPDIWRHKIISI